MLSEIDSKESTWQEAGGAEDRAFNVSLNDVLADWHAWQLADSIAEGYPSRSPSCALGPAGGRDDGPDMEAVDAVIDSIPQPHRTALAFQARNLHCRAQVWSSPRLPDSPQERQVLLMEARNMLARGLIERGVLQ